MPRYIGSRLEGYKKPQSQQWVCDKIKCRYYKKSVSRGRNKFTGCNKYSCTWQCPRFMGKDYYK